MITFKQWQKEYTDVPFKQSYFELLWEMGCAAEAVLSSQDIAPTKYIRVFRHGGWYEILNSGDHYFLHNHLEEPSDYIGKDPGELKENLKLLYSYVTTWEN